MTHPSSARTSAYLLGVTWFIASLIISCFNDVLVKWLGQRLPATEVAFFRFLFSTLSLLPFMVIKGRQAFFTSRPSLHIARGTILCLAITLWCVGLNVSPITVATSISFTVPLFVLVLAAIFLKERVGLIRWIPTLLGFIGIVLLLNPASNDFHPSSLTMVLAAGLFASLDILNKRFVSEESMLCMLFYSALVTTVLGFLPALYFWTSPTIVELAYLFALGAGANLILFCLLKAFALADASAFAPYRYLELLLSAAMGYLFFHELPSKVTSLGALIIIPSTFAVLYLETRHNNRQNS